MQPGDYDNNALIPHLLDDWNSEDLVKTHTKSMKLWLRQNPVKETAEEMEQGQI